MKNVIFRTDGGTKVGLGHIIRSLNLAEGLKEKNIQSIFISRDIDSEVDKRIVRNGHLIEKLPKDADSKEDLNLTVNLIKKYQADLVIADSYEIDQYYLEQLKRLNIALMSIDDLSELHFCSDIVLNQNIGAKASDYSTKGYTRLLLGPKYALLRKKIRDKHLYKREKIIKEVAENLLITLGGSDPHNQTLKVVKSLKGIKNNIKVIVVMGPGYRYEEILRGEIGGDSQFLLIRNPQDIIALMERADIAISGGGSTCYELAYFGVPNIILVLADNQKKIAKGLDDYGTSINLGWFEVVTEDEIKETAEDLMKNREKREEMSKKGRELVDGRGVDRVVKEICATIGKRRGKLSQKKVGQEVLKRLGK